MRLSRLKLIAVFFLTAILSAPLWGATTPLPGTLNYVEGKATIGTEALDAKSIGSAQLQAGESLATDLGRAEILLTPGVFLRLDRNTTVTMISPSLTDTEAGIGRGRAMVEVDQLHKENNIRIEEGGATVELLKTGLYDFDAERGQVRVFEGEALVQAGNQEVKAAGGHEVDVRASGKLKTAKFDKKTDEDDLYRFSSLRSRYLAQANAQAPQVYVSYGWWPAAGWWWNPWIGGYTFIPVAGVFYSPFGWGFYPTRIVVGAPFGYPRMAPAPMAAYRNFGFRRG